MKPTLTWIGRIAGTAIALLVVWIVATNLRSPDDASQPVEAQATAQAPTGTVALQPTPAPQPTPSWVPTTAPGQLPQTEELLGKVSQLIGGYYLWQPGDTPNSRRARTASYIPADVAATLDFQVGDDGPTAAKRQTEKLTVVANFDARKVSIRVSASGDMSVYVIVPLDLELMTFDGTDVGTDRSQVTSASVWRYTNGQWRLTSLTEVGD